MKKTRFALMVAFTATGMLLMSFTSMFPGENALASPEDGSPNPTVVSVAVNEPTSVSNDMSLVMTELGNDLIPELQSRIRYPQNAIDHNIEGTVVIMFTVNPQGGVENVKLVQDIGGQCGEEACRAARSMRVKPAMQNGFAVRQDFYVPLVFSLNSLK
jgi:TonB family protein